MGTGYTRTDVSNNIATGNIVNASDLDNEYDAIEAAFNSSTGHTHDGTSAEGGPITVVGPVQDLVVSATEVKPKTTNTLDLGTSALLYKDAYLQGNMYFRDTALKIVSSADGQLDIDADVEVEITAPTLDIDASTAVTIDTATLTITGSANVTGDLDIDNININGNTIISTNTNGNIALTPNGTGEVDISKVDIDSGAIDGTVIGASSAAAITGTTITGTSFVTSGDMTFGDNDKAVFGNSSDLQIYHDGSNSYIVDSGTGLLAIRGSTAVALQGTNGENAVIATENGAVDLRYDNATKLATTSSGIDVTGTVTADGLTVSSSGSVYPQINSTGGTDAAIRASSAGDTDVYFGNLSSSGGSASGFSAYTGSAVRFDLAPTGDISFYDSTGVTQGLFWDASTQRLGLGTTGPSSSLHISSSNPIIQLTDTDTGADHHITASSGAGGLNISADINSEGSNPYLAFLVTNTERMHIDSSGNVGIGTSSPDAPLHINGGIAGSLIIDGTDSIRPSTNDSLITISGGSATNSGANYTVFGGTHATLANIHRWRVGGTEAARIDSSGNLLVGTTDTNPATNNVAGTRISSDGQVQLSRDGSIVLRVNRASTDGEIINLHKDGTTVGSIGTSGGDLIVGTDDTGLRFRDVVDAVIPFSIAGGVGNDGALDLGESITRFKDLYLSGGVYLGTTGSANRLDDYEEGTFTPEVYDAATGGNQITAGATSGSYTKVGNLVTVHFYTYNLDTTGATAANTLFFRNLPFTAAAIGNQGQGVGAVRYHEIITNGGDLTAITSTGNAHAVIYAMGNNTADYTIRVQDIGNSGVSDIEFSVSYRAA